MTANVFCDVLDRVVHKIVSGILVVQVRPGTQESIRPRCVRSSLQNLIRSRVPGRAGPTPRQHLSGATIWRHSRASARGGLTTSTGSIATSRKNPHTYAPNRRAEVPLDDREAFAGINLPIGRFPQTLEVLAQALSPSVAIDSVRNGLRTAGRPLGPKGAGRPGSTYVEQNALELSNADQFSIVASAQAVLRLIRGKWKIPILATMLDSPVRLGQLQRLIPQASKKVLVQQLHELEKDGIIVRTDFSGKIKHVEYAISAPFGDEVLNLLRLLSDWGLRHTPVMQVPGRTCVLKSPIEWSTPDKNVAEMGLQILQHNNWTP